MAGAERGGGGGEGEAACGSRPGGPKATLEAKMLQ